METEVLQFVASGDHKASMHRTGEALSGSCPCGWTSDLPKNDRLAWQEVVQHVRDAVA